MIARIRVTPGGGWWCAVHEDLPQIAAYGRSEDEARERLRLELAARETNLADELDRLRAVLRAAPEVEEQTACG